VLMDKRNWFMPKWLDRVVPHLSIEGAEFFDALDQIPPDQIPPSPSMPPARAPA
jgi:hypothetical protein